MPAQTVQDGVRRGHVERNNLPTAVWFARFRINAVSVNGHRVSVVCGPRRSSIKRCACKIAKTGTVFVVENRLAAAVLRAEHHDAVGIGWRRITPAVASAGLGASGYRRAGIDEPDSTTRLVVARVTVCRVHGGIVFSKAQVRFAVESALDEKRQVVRIDPVLRVAVVEEGAIVPLDMVKPADDNRLIIVTLEVVA